MDGGGNFAERFHFRFSATIHSRLPVTDGHCFIGSGSTDSLVARSANVRHSRSEQHSGTCLGDAYHAGCLGDRPDGLRIGCHHDLSRFTYGICEF